MTSRMSDAILKKTVETMAASKTATEAATKLGISRSTLTNRLAHARDIGLPDGVAGKNVAPVRKVGLSRKEFLGQFDASTRIREAIRRGIKELGADRIVKDAEFRQLCGETAGPAWGQVADDEEFSPYRFLCDGKKWWATVAVVKYVLANVGGARAV